MSKPIAYLLLTSAFCVAPVLANSQYFESTAPSNEQPAQAAAISESEENFTDSAYYDIKESDEEGAVSDSAEDFVDAAYDTEELDQEAAVSDNAEDFADTAFSTAEPALAGLSESDDEDFAYTTFDTEELDQEEAFASAENYSAPFVDESAQTAVADSGEDYSNTASDTEETEQAESTQDVATAPSNDEPAQPVLESAQGLANIPSTTDEPARVASETTDMAKVNQMIANLENMKGKEVIDPKGELMGTITGVDEETNTAEVELANGRTIALMPEMLTDMGNGIVAADMNQGNAVAAADQSDSDPDLTTFETQ